MTTITALPTPPSRSDPSNFSARADDFLGALPAFATETNAVASEVNTNATNALSYKNQAEAAAATALATASTTPWISGTTYSIGDVTYSSITFLSYRRKTNGAGTTDPSLDSTNWQLIAGSGDVTLTGTQTLSNKTMNSVVLNDGYTEEVFTLTGTTPNLSAANGSIQTWTLTAASNPTDGLSSGQSVILGIDDGTNYTITWPSVVWTKAGGSGAAPSLNAAVRTWVVLWKVGTTLYGSYLGDA